MEGREKRHDSMGRNDRNEFYCISKSFDSRNTVCPPSSPRDGEYSWGTFGSDTFDTRLSIFHPLVLSCCSRYSRPINYFHEFMESDGSINLRGLTSGQPNCCWTFFPFFFFFFFFFNRSSFVRSWNIASSPGKSPPRTASSAASSFENSSRSRYLYTRPILLLLEGTRRKLG